MPSLQELCIRRLLSPYNVAEAESQGIASPFLSPVVRTSDGPQRRRSSGSRNSSRMGTPLFGAQLHQRATSFGSNASRSRSFSSNGGPEDSKFGKRIPTLLRHMRMAHCRVLSARWVMVLYQCSKPRVAVLRRTGVPKLVCAAALLLRPRGLVWRERSLSSMPSLSN